MLAEYFIVFQPSRTTMTLGFSDDQPPIGEEIAGFGVRGKHCHICQKARDPC